MDLTILVEGENLPKMSYKLGTSLLNIARRNTPIRTGNLRASIFMATNSTARKTYIMDSWNAYYGVFLNEGKGPVKRHKDFWSERIPTAMAAELANFYATGGSDISLPILEPIPFKKDYVRNYERSLIKEHGFGSQKYVSASDRAWLSRKYNLRNFKPTTYKALKQSQMKYSRRNRGNTRNSVINKWENSWD